MAGRSMLKMAVLLSLSFTLEGIAMEPCVQIPVFLENASLLVKFHPASAAFSVTDKRTGTTWNPLLVGQEIEFLSCEQVDRGISYEFPEEATQLRMKAVLALDASAPELSLTLSDAGMFAGKLAYPPPFSTSKGDFLIVPLNEGISYPTDDMGVEPIKLILFGGHGLCMPWYGVTDGKQGWMSIVETPDDAGVDIARPDGLLHIAPEWYSQKGAFAYERKIRYVFFDKGGYVAMAKRYRQYAQETGLFKTLTEKRQERPDVDKLVGSANVWFHWKDNRTMGHEMYREMKALGLSRILWSTGAPSEIVAELNELGALTSCYDIYQDAMHPKHFPKLDNVNRRWTSEAWTNDDIMINSDGVHHTSWPVTGKDGKKYFCGVLCDRQLLPYARKRMEPELEKTEFLCRFIDTTTAARWRECYHPEHPMMRRECKGYRMDLLKYVSGELGLVCGAEAGHDAAVPYTDYFEGMTSLWPYRVPNSGHKPFEEWTTVPEAVAKFQTGHYYRLPLFQLVYHDCMVTSWYWGDYNNKLPALWKRRDLFNILYGTSPLYAFGQELWERDKERLVESYKAIIPVVRAVGYSEMLSHEWLTEDHAVQRTTFANGVTVMVNLGDERYTLENGLELLPLRSHVAGMTR